jgi:hypothetical protein
MVVGRLKTRSVHAAPRDGEAALNEVKQRRGGAPRGTGVLIALKCASHRRRQLMWFKDARAAGPQHAPP